MQYLVRTFFHCFQSIAQDFPPYPCVYFREQLFHVCQLEIIDPSLDELFQPDGPILIRSWFVDV